MFSMTLRTSVAATALILSLGGASAQTLYFGGGGIATTGGSGGFVQLGGNIPVFQQLGIHLYSSVTGMKPRQYSRSSTSSQTSKYYGFPGWIEDTCLNCDMPQAMVAPYFWGSGKQTVTNTVVQTKRNAPISFTFGAGPSWSEGRWTLAVNALVNIGYQTTKTHFTSVSTIRYDWWEPQTAVLANSLTKNSGWFVRPGASFSTTYQVAQNAALYGEIGTLFGKQGFSKKRHDFVKAGLMVTY